MTTLTKINKQEKDKKYENKMNTKKSHKTKLNKNKKNKKKTKSACSLSMEGPLGALARPSAAGHMHDDSMSAEGLMARRPGRIAHSPTSETPRALPFAYGQGQASSGGKWAGVAQSGPRRGPRWEHVGVWPMWPGAASHVGS